MPDKQTELVNAILEELNKLAQFPFRTDEVSMARMRRDIISEIANPARRESVLGLLETVCLRADEAFAHFDRALQLADADDYPVTLSHMLDACRSLADTARLQAYLQHYDAPIYDNIATLFDKLLSAYLMLGEVNRAKQLIDKYGGHVQVDDATYSAIQMVMHLADMPEVVQQQYRTVKQALMRSIRDTGNLLSIDQLELGHDGILLNRIILRDNGGAGLFAKVMFDAEVAQSMSPELFDHVSFTVGSVRDNLADSP